MLENSATRRCKISENVVYGFRITGGPCILVDGCEHNQAIHYETELSHRRIDQNYNQQVIHGEARMSPPHFHINHQQRTQKTGDAQKIHLGTPPESYSFLSRINRVIIPAHTPEHPHPSSNPQCSARLAVKKLAL